MKKQLEAELISLAHRILQLKNKSEIIILQQEAQHLYEKLSVLRFVEEHFSSPQPTIGKDEVNAKIESYFAAKEIVTPKEIVQEDVVVPASDVNSVIAQLAASKSVLEEEDENMNAVLEQTSAENETAIQEAEEDNESEDIEAELEEEIEEEIEIPQAEVAQEEIISEVAEIPSVEEDKEETNPFESVTIEESQETLQPETIDEVVKALNLGDDIIDPETIIFDKIDETKSENLSTEEISENNENAPEVAEISENIKAQEEEEYSDEEIEEPVLKTAETEQPTSFTPSFELDFEAKPAEASKYDEPAPSFTFDDLLGKNYSDPVFVTPDELKKVEAEEPVKTFSEDIFTRRPFESQAASFEKAASSTLNDKLSKGITIGLNDRIAFMKNLFNNSSEDYNRVLSQLMTIDNYSEARRFILEMVKPDYNNWEGKEEFEQRFMEIVEKRFL